MEEAVPMCCTSFEWSQANKPGHVSRATCNVDLGGAKYELVLAENKAVDTCAENVALSALLNLSSADEAFRRRCVQARLSCLQLFTTYRSVGATVGGGGDNFAGGTRLLPSCSGQAAA